MIKVAASIAFVASVPAGGVRFLKNTGNARGLLL